MESQAVELVMQLYQALSDGEKAAVAKLVVTERSFKSMVTGSVGSWVDTHTTAVSAAPWVAAGATALSASGSVPIRVRPGGGPVVSAEKFAGWSGISYCRKVEGVDPTKAGAFAVVGDFLKAGDTVQEGDLVFFGFKRPHVGYGLLEVKKGYSVRLVAFEGGGERELEDVELLQYGNSVEGVLEKLKEFYL